MPLTIECTSDGKIDVAYDLEWLRTLMAVSSRSMVPFSYFSDKSRGPVDRRSYPRSTESDFTLGKFETTDPKGGGRSHESPFYAGPLVELLGTGSDIPLADVAILSKRELCRRALGSRVRFLRLAGGQLNGEVTPEFGAYGYPLLCILGLTEHAEQFPRDQAQWRVVQAVFCAELTACLRRWLPAFEVVSREGFGSLFPTLADLPTGLRLDPGLLPPVEGSHAVGEALVALDALIVSVRTSPPKWLTTPQAWLGDLGGYNDLALDTVDRLTSFLHAARGKGPIDYAAVLGSFTGKGNAECLAPVEGAETMGVRFAVDSAGQVEDPRKAKRFRRKARLLRDHKEIADSEVDASGYGSESDYEEEDDEVAKREDKPPAYFLKKYSVATGMAALRMALRYGARYAVALHTKVGWGAVDGGGRAPGLTTWAPYFELDYEDLVEFGGDRAAMSVLVFDGAPNPINIPDSLPTVRGKQWGTIVIDATNLTSMEKAKYFLSTRKLLARPEESGGYGGLLLMVDSASKHPTGGDLVHGVIRAYGTPRALAAFTKLMVQHLKGGAYKAAKQTFLSESETEGRRDMISARLLTRNKDIFRLVSALQTE